MASPKPRATDPYSFGQLLASFRRWCSREPLSAILWISIAAALVYFFGFYRVFMQGHESAAVWAWRGWNDENDQVHCRFIVPLVMGLLWYHRTQLGAAIKEPSNRGLIFVLVGLGSFVIAARCLQPRFAVLALPLLTYGTVEFLWGRQFARHFIFPCVLMLFMIPIGGLIQRTVSLQLIASGVVGVLCRVLGIEAQVVGDTITVDGYPFQVAGGCSGIRSLMAMSMLAALYVHFTQTAVWKKLTIFAGSLVFALVGNIARLFTVVLIAKWWDPKIAGGLYHDYSGFIFFPFAVMAMVGFSNLLNRDWNALWERWTAREEAAAPARRKSYGERGTTNGEAKQPNFV